MMTDLRALLATPRSLGALAVHDDAIALLPLMPDCAVDVTITDPPYDETTHHGARSLAGGTVGDLGIAFDPLASLAFVGELLRVTRRWVVCFCALEQLGAYKAAAGGMWSDGGCFVRSGIWDRIGGAPQFSGDRPAQGAEGIAILHSRTSRVPLRWNGGGHRAVYTFPIVRGARMHRTQKPVPLLDKLVYHYSERGELVFDAFAGSMTTGIAALKADRLFYGIERDATSSTTGAIRLARLTADRASRDPDDVVVTPAVATL